MQALFISYNGLVSFGYVGFVSQMKMAMKYLRAFFENVFQKN